MFGDDFKKSLEPIKVSDELLEKTRKAIEAARLEEAKKTLDNASRKSFSSGKWLKTGAMVACVLLVGIGIFAILPYLTSGMSKTSSDATTARRIMASDTVAANLEGRDNYYSSKNKSEYFDDVAEETTAASMEQAQEETTEAEENDNEHLSVRPDDSTESGKTSPTLLFASTANIKGRTLSIDTKSKNLFWTDSSRDLQGNQGKEDVALPTVPMSEADDTIEGIAFFEDPGILGVIVSSKESETAVKGYCTLYLYSLNGDEWEGMLGFAQTGKYWGAGFSEGQVHFYTCYQDDPDTKQIDPLFRFGNAAWQPFSSDVISRKNDGRGGTYTIETAVSLTDFSTHTNILYR